MSNKHSPQDDLRARCLELLNWHRTGVLSGKALRAMARRKYGDDPDALQRAERDTETEALQFVANAQPLMRMAGRVGWAANVPGSFTEVHWAGGCPPVDTEIYTIHQPKTRRRTNK